MRTVLVLTAVLLAVCVASSFAMRNTVAPISEVTEWKYATQPNMGGAAAALADTIWFGGSGAGNGSVVRGGMWNWEASNGEPPQFFLDGDPVGNQYRDGFIFEDRTARNGPYASGIGHWDASGNYNFLNRSGSFAHRATTHANDGRNDGPDPLRGVWSVWIGTNLYLNPEDCAWAQTSGYGDGWSQGIQKSFAIGAGNGGRLMQLRFWHRYANEAGFDTNWVEINTGTGWYQVGTQTNPQGIFNGGDKLNPQPTIAGEQRVVDLLNWPDNNPGTLQVRFRLAADAYFSDNNEGGDFFWAWQIDDVELLIATVSQGTDTFEGGMNGWQPSSFEGFDYDLTFEYGRPAGRIESLSLIANQPDDPCPEDCGVAGRVLLFSDRDGTTGGLNDSFQDSYATSPAFSIGGNGNPDLRGATTRLLKFDWARNGGTQGFFETGASICWVYNPFNASRCPYTPSAGSPGAGQTFNWSQTNFATCDFFGQPAGPNCTQDGIYDMSPNTPADADSIILHLGGWSQCRSEATCDANDGGFPYWDNVALGVVATTGTSIQSDSIDRYTDNYPTINGPVTTTPVRTDGAHSLSQNLQPETPLRWVRSDTAAAKSGAANTAMYLRFAVERGPCQPNLNHPFFAAFPPSAPGTYPGGLVWHAARMDTARLHGTGVTSPGGYMTCFHDSDPRNGTCWMANCPPIEPCDDILPDGLFTAGTNVYYFFESRNAQTGALTGTFPFARNKAPIRTTLDYRNFWLEINNLPNLTPACDGTYANNMLVVFDYATNGVPARNTTQRTRLVDTLKGLGLEFDVYDHVGTNYGGSYDGIGRREDRTLQQPRPTFNGATNLMLNNYDCIWYAGGLSTTETLSDSRTNSSFGGHPSQDQQKLETWINGCTAGNNRLLVLEGIGWASGISPSTTNGTAFLTNRGVTLLAADYAQQLAAADLRRCARIVSSRPADRFDTGEIFGSGCPEDLPINVFGAVPGGGAEAVANFVESLEDGNDPVNCNDDVNRPTWLSVVRRRVAPTNCAHSASMSFSFAELNPLNCTDQCLFGAYQINGENAELAIDIFTWAGCPINANPIGVDPAAAPRFVNELYQAQPNPANPSATIRYTIAQRGHVSLKIFDVSGRLVRTLVDQVQEPATAPFEAVWDGVNDGGQHVGSGVFFYQIDAPGFSSSKKLVILK